DPPSRRVYLEAWYAWACEFAGGRVRLAHNWPDSALSAGGLSKYERSSHVGPVPVDDGSQVNHHRVPWLTLAASRPTYWDRWPRGAANDARRNWHLSSEALHDVDEPCGDLLLR